MKGSAIAIGLVILLVVFIVGGYAVQYFTADVRGRVSANEQIKAGSNRISQYDKFFNACASVQALEANFDTQSNTLMQTTREDDRVRIRSNLDAIQALRASAIATYNADASKSYTDGQFKSSDLPYRLAAEAYVAGGQHTRCAS